MTKTRISKSTPQEICNRSESIFMSNKFFIASLFVTLLSSACLEAEDLEIPEEDVLLEETEVVAGSGPWIARNIACQEQAENWCGTGGTAARRCQERYRSQCTAQTTTPVLAQLHETCLDDMTHTSPPWTDARIPGSCRQTWRGGRVAVPTPRPPVNRPIRYIDRRVACRQQRDAFCSGGPVMPDCSFIYNRCTSKTMEPIAEIAQHICLLDIARTPYPRHWLNIPPRCSILWLPRL